MKKKIAFCIDHMGSGGAQELMLNYMENSALLGTVEVFLIQIKADNVFAERIKNLGCRHYVIDSRPSSYWQAMNPVNFFKLVRLLRRIGPDVLHTQLFISFVYGVPAARIAGVPHVTYAVDYLKRQLPFWWSGVLRLFAFLVTHFFVYHEKEYKAFGLPRRLFKRYPLCMRFEDNVPASAVVPILFEERFGNRCCATIGRLIESKGHHFVIEAVAQLRKKHPDLTLVVVGEGPYEVKLRALVKKLDLENAVFFTGYVKNLNRLFSKISLCVSASIDEVINVASRWALYCGVPLVKFFIQEAPECVDIEQWGCGLYAANRSVDDLAAKMAIILADEQHRVRMGENGKRCIREMFDPQKAAAAFDEVYRELLKF